MGPAARLGPGEKVRVEALPGLKTVWEDYDEWDDDYAWQAEPTLKELLRPRAG